jgi:hypothetical protein
MASFCLLRENSGWFMVLVGISKQLKFVSVFIRLSISSSSSIDLNRRLAINSFAECHTNSIKLGLAE